jgi:hypothetical protein
VVPSLFHSSLPVMASLARNMRVLPRAVRFMRLPPGVPGAISCTIVVPAAVPSLFHSAAPVMPSLAWKNSVVPTAVSCGTLLAGTDEVGPTLMSLTSTVPAAVPSVFHSSVPVVPSLAVKNRVSPTILNSVDDEEGPEKVLIEPPLGLRSLKSVVPAAVPSVLQSSIPVPLPSLAPK